MWTDWGSWSDCSQSCGSGRSTRRRSVAVYGNGEGEECMGNMEEYVKCNEEDCPVKGKIILFDYVHV